MAKANKKKNITRAPKVARVGNTSETYRRRSRGDAVTGQGTKHEEAAATLEGRGGGTIDVIVIRTGKTKHGPRGNWRELEFAQLAIQSLHGAPPPKHLDRSKLTRDVNAWLKNNPDWDYGEISRPTVPRALKKVRP